ncbi:MAG: aminotransferase class V-fold PLP-dependent enzyme [Candidatus Sulfopaludibacter sp.]|nr:aminotransferase class V-fold PLP-dependent enzyme [Candidatus Sulfopaludibacter sp.]
MNRRNLFQMAAGAAAFAMQDDTLKRLRAAASATKDRSPEEMAKDEDYWAEIRQSYTVDRNMINLNNGHVGPSPRIVQDALRQYLEYSDMGPYTTMINTLERQIEPVRRHLAKVAGCDPEEMAITRNASESLENAQYGIDLKPGDEVLTTNQDYGRMIETFRQRERREGIVLKQISFPVPPPSMDDLYNRFERAVTPKTKLILVCHITNRTGQIFPIKRICQMAHARGIPVIVDGAHAFNHFPFSLADLDCDYYGVSLHKWTGAPVGTGFLYVRKSRIAGTWSLMASGATQVGDIRKFEEIGTHPAANHNAITAALIFNEGIGIDRKAARLRYLRDRWAHRLVENKKCKTLHSEDPAQSCGIGFLAFNGVDPGKMRETLIGKYSIYTAYVPHEEYTGLRITPHVYTTLQEIDTFSAAVEKEVG